MLGFWKLGNIMKTCKDCRNYVPSCRMCGCTTWSVDAEEPIPIEGCITEQSSKGHGHNYGGFEPKNEIHLKGGDYVIKGLKEGIYIFDEALEIMQAVYKDQE